MGRGPRRWTERKDGPMLAWKTVVNGLARGRMAAAEAVLALTVWLAVAADATGAQLAGWLLGHGRRLRRAPAQGVVEVVIIAAIFAGLALVVGKLIGPAVVSRVNCLLQELQSSSTAPTPPNC